MITRLEVFSPWPDAPVLPLGGFMPNDDPVQIRDIEGLGPVKAEVTSTLFATGRGELFQNASTGKRNIVLTLGLNPDWETQTMSTLRQALYAYFLPEAWTKLRFFSDHMPTCDIEGVVESFEPNMFSQDPEIQISILCHKPDFVEVDATIVTGLTSLDAETEFAFTYLGTVATGYELKLEVTPENVAYTGPVTITSTAWEEAQLLEVDPITIDVTQFLKVVSVRNAKRVSEVDVSSGDLTNKLAQMSGESVWPELKPGENAISVVAEEENLAWTLAYFNKFGGL